MNTETVIEAPVAVPAQTTPAVPDFPKTVDYTLVRILGWKRSFRSVTELAFMKWLHDEIKARGFEANVMAEGCVSVTVPRTDGKKSQTLFSCHTDTVHWSQGDLKDSKPQHLMYDESFGHIFLNKTHADAGSCLGADDGAGVWLMLEMILHRRPGTYLFHRGEEKGGIGAYAMLGKHKQWLEEFDIAVAFDRPNNDEVITHQGNQRCCSDKFGNALVKALGEQGLVYKTSTGGVFTDTKVYRTAIGECTNIGVGYGNQHSQDEFLDYGHLLALRDACLNIDWDTLPAERDPKAYEAPATYAPQKRGVRRDAWDGQQGFGWSDDSPRGKKKTKAKPNAEFSKKGLDRIQHAVDTLLPEQEIEGMSMQDIEFFCGEEPGVAALLMQDMAAEIVGLRAKLKFLKGQFQ
jgi:hypothetical protein